jgi:hypothetical protein
MWFIQYRSIGKKTLVAKTGSFLSFHLTMVEQFENLFR